MALLVGGNPNHSRNSISNSQSMLDLSILDPTVEGDEVSITYLNIERIVGLAIIPGVSKKSWSSIEGNQGAIHQDPSISPCYT
jgi:hypothetical protein